MKPASGVRIRVTKNGPYIVSGLVPMTVESIVCDDEGESREWRVDSRLMDRESCGLCRCGKSDAKPLCDGSHALLGFDGTEVASRAPYAEQAEMVHGPRLDLADARSLCADARFCHRDGAVWHRILEDSDEAEQLVRDECELCPSGRYTAIDSESGERLEPQLDPSIAFVQDVKAAVSGPIWVRGGIEVEAADGETYEVRNRVTLCRCGQSKNKPFCDGSHVECGFHDHL
ncbi:MAG: iron-binding protein [Coriobacteriia bacterium]|nr:iron-binding protein [Coriobacteriia bacterium]